MPIDYKLYPKNWKKISEQIRWREHDFCKFCKAPNGVMIRRNKRDGSLYIIDNSSEDYVGWDKPIKVVLTVAHLDHDIQNNDPENLAALCQRCHLRYDAKHHVETRRKRMENDYAKRGIDYDLRACLENNNMQFFGVDDIEKVLAVYEGERDTEDWRWILELKEAQEGKKFVAMQGWCDYTGWDCQSGAMADFHETALIALKSFISDKPLQPHWGNENDEKVIYVLCRQLVDEKHLTWREKMDKEFGVQS